MTTAKWPAGIDVIGRFHRWQTRRCVPVLRDAIERLAAGSANVEAYDVAIDAFVKQRKISGPRHPGRQALDRLQRLYIRRFRRELIGQQHYLEAAARRALMGTGMSAIEVSPDAAAAKLDVAV
jgi:hypothetical protein